MNPNPKVVIKLRLSEQMFYEKELWDSPDGHLTSSLLIPSSLSVNYMLAENHGSCIQLYS